MHFKQMCGAIGCAAIKLAEDVNVCIEFELTQRCLLMLLIEHMVELLT